SEPRKETPYTRKETAPETSIPRVAAPPAPLVAGSAAAPAVQRTPTSTPRGRSAQSHPHPSGRRTAERRRSASPRKRSAAGPRAPLFGPPFTPHPGPGSGSTRAPLGSDPRPGSFVLIEIVLPLDSGPLEVKRRALAHHRLHP